MQVIFSQVISMFAAFDMGNIVEIDMSCARSVKLITLERVFMSLSAKIKSRKSFHFYSTCLQRLFTRQEMYAQCVSVSTTFVQIVMHQLTAGVTNKIVFFFCNFQFNSISVIYLFVPWI